MTYPSAVWLGTLDDNNKIRRRPADARITRRRQVNTLTVSEGMVSHSVKALDSAFLHSSLLDSSLPERETPHAETAFDRTASLHASLHSLLAFQSASRLSALANAFMQAPGGRRSSAASAPVSPPRRTGASATAFWRWRLGHALLHSPDFPPRRPRRPAPPPAPPPPGRGRRGRRPRCGGGGRRPPRQSWEARGPAGRGPGRRGPSGQSWQSAW